MYVWPFIPQRTHTEVLEWKTNVLRAKGAEQRISLREAPRHFYDYDYVMDAQQLSRAKILARAGIDLYLPLWSELTHIASAAEAATSLAFDTDYAHYIVEGQAIIWAADDSYEVVTLDTVTGSGVTWTGGLAATYSPAIVMPVKTCRLQGRFKVSRRASVDSRAQARFLTTETESIASVAADPSTPVVAADVLLDCNALISGSQTETATQEVEDFDGETGGIWFGDARNYQIRSGSMTWLSLDKSALWDVREWLHARRGKWKGFYVPTWNNDLNITTAINSSDTTIVIDDIGYDEQGVGVRDAMITTSAGARVYLHITSADNTITPGSETLTLSVSVGVTLALVDIDHCCFINFSRLNADRVEIRHRAANQSAVSVPVIETSTL
jgi:hypothetical protein